MAPVVESEEPVVDADVRPLQARPKAAPERRVGGGGEGPARQAVASGGAPGGQDRLVGRPDGLDVVFGGHLDEQTGEGGVLVEVPVTVDVIEGQARFAPGLELGAHLAAGLLAAGAGQGDAHAGEERPCRQVPIAVDQGGDLARWGGARGVEQGQVQTDTQGRHGLGAADGVGGAQARHHQAGAGEDALAVALLDRFIDFVGEAEVVGGDDQAAISRARGHDLPPVRQACATLRGLREKAWGIRPLWQPPAA